MTHIANLSDLMPAGEPQSDTPRTDADLMFPTSKLVSVDFARQLERELAQAKDTLDMMTGQLQQARENWQDAEARFECAERANGDNIRALAKAQDGWAATGRALGSASEKLAQAKDMTKLALEAGEILKLELSQAKEDLDYLRKENALIQQTLHVAVKDKAALLEACKDLLSSATNRQHRQTAQDAIAQAEAKP